MHRFKLGNAGSRSCPISSKRQSQFLVFEGVKRGLDNVVGYRDVGDERKLMERNGLVVAVADIRREPERRLKALRLRRFPKLHFNEGQGARLGEDVNQSGVAALELHPRQLVRDRAFACLDESVGVVPRDGKHVLVTQFLRPCPEHQKKLVVLDMNMDRAIGARGEVAFCHGCGSKIAPKKPSDTRRYEKAANDHGGALFVS